MFGKYCVHRPLSFLVFHVALLLRKIVILHFKTKSPYPHIAIFFVLPTSFPVIRTITRYYRIQQYCFSYLCSKKQRIMIETKKGILRISSDEKVWFTSDTHFGHKNIIRFCNRPFVDIDEMNGSLIENWNSLVGDNDIVFHLGDFSVGGAMEWSRLLDQLHGRIFLILGNHDMNNVGQEFMNRFQRVAMELLIQIGKQKIYLNHYPFLCYNSANDSVWQLFGHVHTSPRRSMQTGSRLGMLLPSQYDVGVDNNNFYPVSYHQVKNIITQEITNRKQHE